MRQRFPWTVPYMEKQQTKVHGEAINEGGTALDRVGLHYTFGPIPAFLLHFYEAATHPFQKYDSKPCLHIADAEYC